MNITVSLFVKAGLVVLEGLFVKIHCGTPAKDSIIKKYISNARYEHDVPTSWYEVK